jgi:hypothetical protein
MGNTVIRHKATWPADGPSDGAYARHSSVCWQLRRMAQRPATSSARTVGRGLVPYW